MRKLKLKRKAFFVPKNLDDSYSIHRLGLNVWGASALNRAKVTNIGQLRIATEEILFLRNGCKQGKRTQSHIQEQVYRLAKLLERK